MAGAVAEPVAVPTLVVLVAIVVLAAAVEPVAAAAPTVAAVVRPKSGHSDKPQVLKRRTCRERTWHSVRIFG